MDKAASKDEDLHAPADEAASGSRSLAELDFWIGCVGAPVLILEKASLTVLRANANALSMFGLDADGVENTPIESVLGREAGMMLSQIWSNAPVGQPGEAFLIRALVQGQERVLVVQVTKIVIDGEACRLFTFRDAPPPGSVALAGWQENIISMLNWLPFGFEIASTDDQIQFANTTFKEMFGYTQDEISSIEDWWRLAYPDPAYRDYARSQWYSSIETARRENREMTPFDLTVMTSGGIEKRIQFRHRTIGQFNVNLYIDVTTERSHAEQLRTLANTDPLTGLLNRRIFFDEAEEVFSRGADTSAVGVLMLDIDHFKSVNDTHGHRAGDAVLIEFARRCAEAMPADARFARLGGEEFAMLFSAATPQAVFDAAERIRRAVADTPFSLDDSSLVLGVSIGATHGHPGTEDFEAAIQRADLAVYGAKRAGRNRVVMSAPETGRAESNP